MTRPSQKKEERWFLDRFLRVLRLEDIDEIAEGDPVPDFILYTTDTTIGVEVTQLFHAQGDKGRPRQAIETTRQHLLNAVEDLWQNRDLPYVEVHVFFNSDADYTKAEIGGVAADLAELVQQHLPRRNSVGRVEWNWERRGEFPKGIEGCSIVRLDAYSRSYWSEVDGAYVPQLTAKHLSEVVKRKNKPEYVIGDETWLLVVTDEARLSSAFDIEESALASGTRAVFDRVFLLEAVRAVVHEITLHRSPPANGA